jgi:hypothetical protein
MEILIRKLDSTNYVWKNAMWTNGEYYFKDEDGDDRYISANQILAVKDDNRIGYAQCAHCGALIENNPESIERHYAEEEAKKDCLSCRYLTTYGRAENKQVTYTPNGNGTYKVVNTYDTKLACGYGYWNQDILSESAKKECIHMQCRRYGVHPINDVFVKYPGPFVRFVTVDVLNEKQYPYERYNARYFEYDMKCRDTLKACVNDLGIIDHFIVTMRGHRHTLYYSDKYDKLFYYDGNGYNDEISHILSESKEKQVRSKISALYKEVKEK